MKTFSSVLLLLLPVGQDRTLNAQATEVAIVTALAAHLQERYVGKTVFIDPMYYPAVPTRDHPYPMDPAVLQTFSRALRAESRARDEVYRCAGNLPPTCNLLLGAEVFVAISEPSGAGPVTIQVTELLQTASTRQP